MNDSWYDTIIEYYKDNDVFKDIRNTKLARLVNVPLLPNHMSDLMLEAKKLMDIINRQSFSIPIIKVDDTAE